MVMVKKALRTVRQTISALYSIEGMEIYVTTTEMQMPNWAFTA